MRRISGLPILFALCVPSLLNAQVVYDNGSYVGAATGRNITDFAIADDLIVSSSLTFNGIRFYSLSTGGPGFANFSGTVSWYIQTSTGTTPNAIPGGTILNSGSVSGVAVSIVNTGNTVVGFPVFQLDFNIPTISLGAGTYWLRLKENLPSDPSDGTPIFWVQTNGPITGNGFRSEFNPVSPTTWNFDGTSTTNDLSYQLTFSAVPEPTTWALIGIGVFGGAGFMYRRMRKNKLALAAKMR